MRRASLGFFLFFSVGHIILASISLATANWTTFSTSLGQSCSFNFGLLGFRFAGCNSIFSPGNILAPAYVPGSIVVSSVPLTPFIDGYYLYEQCQDASFAKGGCREAYLAGRSALGLQVPAIVFQAIAAILSCVVARRPGPTYPSAYWLTFLSVLNSGFLMPAGLLLWLLMAHFPLLDASSTSLSAYPWRFRSTLDFSFAVDAAACGFCLVAAALSVSPSVEGYRFQAEEAAERERRRQEQILSLTKGVEATGASAGRGKPPPPPMPLDGEGRMRPVAVLSMGDGEMMPERATKSRVRLGWAEEAEETPGKPGGDAAEAAAAADRAASRRSLQSENEGGGGGGKASRAASRKSIKFDSDAEEGRGAEPAGPGGGRAGGGGGEYRTASRSSMSRAQSVKSLKEAEQNHLWP
eukprot:tig00000455_g1024.t1